MSLHLGHVDPGKKPSNIKNWLQPYHKYIRVSAKNSKFRGEKFGQWHNFTQLSSAKVRPLQRFLQNAGFYPKAKKTGIFGYGTRSALRLFQEYIRNIEGDKSIGAPDGWTGPKTDAHIARWKRDNLTCHWNQFSLKTPSEEYIKWFQILNKAKLQYLTSEDPVIENLRSFFKTRNASSLPPERWTFRPYDTHLLGVRRHPETAFTDRPNDDLFILLIRGMVFKFWGSTDPNPKMVTNVQGAPFLTEGQHKYYYGWHKVSSKEKVYMALKPYPPGTLVFRDRNKRNKLLPDDIQNGFDNPNTTINIHWTPNGMANWSAGCQVINGESYIDTDDKLISCREYCASGYRSISSSKTKGAYNVLTDLVVCFAQANNDTVWYTLGRLNNLEELASGFDSQFVDSQVSRLKG
jgi:hypothetical protein